MVPWWLIIERLRITWKSLYNKVSVVYCILCLLACVRACMNNTARSRCLWWPNVQNSCSYTTITVNFVSLPDLQKITYMIPGYNVQRKCVITCPGRHGSWLCDNFYLSYKTDKRHASTGWLSSNLPRCMCTLRIGNYCNN